MTTKHKRTVLRHWSGHMTSGVTEYCGVSRCTHFLGLVSALATLKPQAGVGGQAAVGGAALPQPVSSPSSPDRIWELIVDVS